MIPTLTAMVHALLWDPLAFRRWCRGFFMWLGGAAVMVAGAGWEVAQHWTFREWVGRMAIAGVLGVGGLISVGEKNAAAAAGAPPPAPPPAPPAAGFARLWLLGGLVATIALLVLLWPALLFATGRVAMLLGGQLP